MPEISLVKCRVESIECYSGVGDKRWIEHMYSFFPLKILWKGGQDFFLNILGERKSKGGRRRFNRVMLCVVNHVHLIHEINLKPIWVAIQNIILLMGCYEQ